MGIEYIISYICILWPLPLILEVQAVQSKPTKTCGPTVRASIGCAKFLNMYTYRPTGLYRSSYLCFHCQWICAWFSKLASPRFLPIFSSPIFISPFQNVGFCLCLATCFHTRVLTNLFSQLIPQKVFNTLLLMVHDSCCFQNCQKQNIEGLKDLYWYSKAFFSMSLHPFVTHSCYSPCLTDWTEWFKSCCVV